MKNYILIVDDLHPAFMEQAEALGFTCDYQPNMKLEEAFAIINNYDGLAIRSKFQVDKAFIDEAKNLRFICRAGAGMDNIDEDYAIAKGIELINAPEGNMDAVGEHAMGLLLSLMNNINRGDAEIRDGKWLREENRGHELKGKTVGIIGYGHMGSSFAKRLSGFGVLVIVYDKYKTGFSDQYAREVSMEEIVRTSDVLSLHIPLTKETDGLVDDEYLFHFKKPIFFLNTARGKVVKTQAVLNAIKQGKIIGAGLDVLEVEKFPALAEQQWFEELRLSDRVILSPHVAGWTFESYRKISEVMAAKLKELGLIGE
ncbi:MULTISPECIES: 2-hydroxyacid dehydrogenase [unclassified Mucilaginibacter]|uniref:2-hydroxyacid dehydrogenase n=1 Tax=unclassified Mucilaginibacter TaxID=2617802 RepID=UPI002AC933D1|nr:MULTISPECIES: 2-hydroxyacid dehydrogenase [unclassified Mucilaginibacter]MEB0262024.1 2-hydroxyacid dehydrogenase [Mucilaginibacter sp. 10I4]MEB0279712.1 2-hydroxyacid dehydrogenase [Mucilaginibacter sp. 10B2]MEB0301695.1 2-hydroxyacid dehydrogenase [Mucilaginibacter sp. 5C4]WPX23729.1 2-hydroxyacid dehydrogenase [Mucilaginibacter sp. 5C4]